MQQTKHYETQEGVSEMMLFLDGNTVALTLHALSDRYFFSVRFLHAMAGMWQDGIQNMLIDCEALKCPEDIDIKRFIHMERIVSKQGIRFLLLDASIEVRRRLEVLLPDAIWINSDAAGYFGQTLKAKISSSP